MQLMFIDTYNLNPNYMNLHIQKPIYTFWPDVEYPSSIPTWKVTQPSAFPTIKLLLAASVHIATLGAPGCMHNLE